MTLISKKYIDSLRKAFDDLNSYILITNSDSSILYANQNVLDQKGIERKKISGRTPGKLWGGQMKKDFYQNMWHQIKVKKLPFISEISNLDKDGKSTKEHLQIAPIVQDGNSKYFLQIQASVADSEEQENFQQEFKNVMSTADLKLENLISFILHWSSKLEEIEKAANHFDENTELIEALFLPFQELNKLEDKKLISKALENPKAYGDLFEKYQSKIFYYLNHKLNRKEDAEDLLQETFLKAFNAHKDFTYQDYTYLSFIMKIAHNLLVNHYKSPKTLLLNQIKKLPFEDKEARDKKLEIEQLWDYSKDLSKTEQKVLKLKYQDDLLIADIAKQLGKSENAIKLTLSRARKKLRELSK